MANKTFVVAYLIRARDQYSKIAAKVAQTTERMKKKIKEAGKAFAEFSGKMRKAGKILSIGATLPIAFLAKSLKDAARDAIETESKFGTVFESVGSKAEKVAANLAQNYGLASTESKKLLADTGDLLTGFGFSEKAALDMAEQVNKMAVDLASFQNFAGGAEGASVALTKALLGESESAKALGIVIRQGTPEFKKNIKEIMRSQRVSLLQAKAIEILRISATQSKKAIGDFARTQQDLANQERITEARTRDLKDSFGKLLLPIALKITKVLQKVVTWMANLSPGTKKAILIVGGLIAVLGPLLLALGSLVLIWPVLVAGVAAFGTAMAAAFWPITAIAAAAFLIIKNWEKVSTFFENVGAKIFKVVDAVRNFSLGDIGATIKQTIFGTEAEKGMVTPASRVDVGVNVGLDKGLKQTSPAAVAINNARRADVGMATSG